LDSSVRKWTQLAAGVLSLCLITAVCFSLGVSLAIPGFLYLLVVVWQSLATGFAPAAVVSIAAVGCLNYFFTPPVLTFNIDNPLDALALGAYLVTSLVITRLASQARGAAQTAERKRREAAQLYQAASRLLALDAEAAMDQSLTIFRDAFPLRTVCLWDGERLRSEPQGEAGEALRDKTRQAYRNGVDRDETVSGTYIRCLRVAGSLAGAIGFEGLPDGESVAGPLSVLAASTAERARAFRAECNAAAAVQTEILRAAFVDAFAHEFKTPMGTILAVSEAIRQTGPLTPEQSELTEILETEAERLNRVAVRLLQTARVEREDVRPRLRAHNIASLVADTVGNHRAIARDRQIALDLGGQTVVVHSDAELFHLALSQLLENALKYSPPTSPVCVRLETLPDAVTIAVTNEGSIAAGDRERIFERFYRGSNAAAQAPGTGVGLYVARKIAVAHGGTLELDDAENGSATFCLRLPAVRSETADECNAT
jgi:two-component system sensor histidine kinase KdpD